MKKLILALIALACAFAISSCNDQVQEKPEKEEHRCDRCHNELEEQYHSTWMKGSEPAPTPQPEKTYRRW